MTGNITEQKKKGKEKNGLGKKKKKKKTVCLMMFARMGTVICNKSYNENISLQK